MCHAHTICAFLAFAASLQAQDPSGTSATLGPGNFYLPPEEPLIDNLRLNGDIWTNFTHDFPTDKSGFLTIMGIDSHKVFNNGHRDIGTAVVQVSAMRADGLPKTPPLFDDNHDWAILYRSIWFNYTGWSSEGVSIRTGHMEYPYGLEWNDNTGGTLRQVLTARTLGSKLDWGVTANGELENFDYEVGVFRGSGNEYRDFGDNYAVCGRIGTPSTNNTVLGLSGFSARRLVKDDLQNRWRAGVDAVVRLEMFNLMAEANWGQTDGIESWNGLAEAGCSSNNNRITSYVRCEWTGGERTRGGDTNTSTRAVIGAAFATSDSTQISLQFLNDIEPPQGTPHAQFLQVQFRTRF
jgi:hypothetical protein